MMTKRNRNNPLIAIGCGQFGLSIMQTMFMFYYVKVYLNKFGVQSGWFTLAQALFMIWNAINDPLFGYLQDTPGSRLNSRSYVIKTFSPFLAFSFIFMWIPWNTTGSYLEGIHLIVALFLYDAFFSAIGVAWAALFADTTADQPHLRVKAMKWSQIAILLSVNIIAITEKMSYSLEDFGTFQNITLVVGFLGFGCLWKAGSIDSKPRINKHKGRDEDEADLISRSSSDDDLQGSSFTENLKRSWNITKQIVNNKNFVAIIITNFLQTARSVAHMNFASIATELVIPQSILAKGSLKLSLFFALLTLGPQLLLIFNESLISRIGAQRIMQASYVVSFLSGFMYLFSSSPYAIIIFMVIDCVTVHTIAPLFNIIISDFVDDDAKRNKRKNAVPSIVFSLNALFIKPSQSLAPVIVVYCLNFSGYQEYLTTKTATSELQDAMKLILFATPLLLGIVQYFVLKHVYTIKHYEKHDLVIENV